MIKSRALSIATLALAYAKFGLAFFLQDTYQGHEFFDRWDWETFDDPTHGRVNYVDQPTAKTTNLSFASFNKFVMRADSTSIISSDPAVRGRNSVRIISQEAYSDSVIVLDLQHMPTGCGTWPAFWTLSKAGPWPTGGEIDIIEGVHLNTQNLASLHTTPDCSMPPWRLQTGQTVSSDCNTAVNYNQGCGTSGREDSYGTGFNSAGGGWYVMERSQGTGISVWFWARDDPFVPIEIRHGFNVLIPNPTWGLPSAQFPTVSCDYNSHFDAHQMVFDITFCGDWAGAPTIWQATGCSTTETCNEYVDNNPGQFKEAYWEVNSLRVYTDNVSPGISIGGGIGIGINI